MWLNVSLCSINPELFTTAIKLCYGHSQGRLGVQPYMYVSWGF